MVRIVLAGRRNGADSQIAFYQKQEAANREAEEQLIFPIPPIGLLDVPPNAPAKTSDRAPCSRGGLRRPAPKSCAKCG